MMCFNYTSVGWIIESTTSIATTKSLIINILWIKLLNKWIIWLHFTLVNANIEMPKTRLFHTTIYIMFKAQTYQRLDLIYTL